MAVSLSTGLRNLFFVLGCLITASVIYTVVTDGLPFRKELLTPWMAATLIDFYINVVLIGAWIVYKEVSWISRIFWIVLLVCLGSITTCFYIVLQFLKLSPKESEKDPIYFLLVRPKSKKEEERNIFSVVVARVLFSALGCLMLGTLIYTIITAGSPFHRHVLFPKEYAPRRRQKDKSSASSNLLFLFSSSLSKELLQVFSSSSFLFVKLFSVSAMSTQPKSSPIVLGVVVICLKGQMSSAKAQVFITPVDLLESKPHGRPSYSRWKRTAVILNRDPTEREVITRRYNACSRQWLSATLIDFYISLVAFMCLLLHYSRTEIALVFRKANMRKVWVAYKESSWIHAAFWIFLFICSGSISTCAYLVLQLFSLSSDDPVYLVLFSSRSRWFGPEHVWVMMI
ncbi:hypothetical protein M9H77_31823 [Catharanthus roseus]|uniref:Uncharacterized protein n=1 Tax=Catharanthus roseus TaxID=4058 RepID=A0ACC0A238_CATRO|nr:hypothetical protein M9H77_31823 [Catharanthus roseus]